MKFRFTFILLIASLFFSAESFAQVDRSIAPGQYRNKKKKAEPYDFVEATVKYLTKELKLDDFQAAAVRNIMKDEEEAIMTLAKDQEMREVERVDKGKEITDRIDAKIIKLLSPEQAAKYTEMQEKKKKKG